MHAGLVHRAADEAEAVGSSAARRTAGRRCASEGAQHGAVADVEELDVAVAKAGERVLVVGQCHEGDHPVVVQLRDARRRSRVPSVRHTRTPSHDPLRMRWPSGVAATVFTTPACPSRVLTRLLLATLHTLTRFSGRPEPPMMCWPSASPQAWSCSWCAPQTCGRASRRRCTAGPRGSESQVHAVGARRGQRRRCPVDYSSSVPPRRCARERRRASTASRCGPTRR